jgi:anti-sigma regulatory factor (Ser/Thr protein kinase)
MTNHADHNHPATPAARKACREYRRAAIRECQLAYMEMDAGTMEVSEYYAYIDLLTYKLDNCTMAEAFAIVETGPIIH